MNNIAIARYLQYLHIIIIKPALRLLVGNSSLLLLFWGLNCGGGCCRRRLKIKGRSILLLYFIFLCRVLSRAVIPKLILYSVVVNLTKLCSLSRDIRVEVGRLWKLLETIVWAQQRMSTNQLVVVVYPFSKRSFHHIT